METIKISKNQLHEWNLLERQGIITIVKVIYLQGNLINLSFHYN